jgi:DNA polymerase III alpha subunit (gram-positive type)
MTLIHADLQDAYQTFLRFLASANQNCTAPEVLDEVYWEKVDRLDQCWRVLEKLAYEGLEKQLSPQLNMLLKEWAIKEAVELLLRYQSYGGVDHSDPGLQHDFNEKLARQHQALSSELVLHLQEGKKQREQASAERARDWQSIAAQAIENQYQQQQQWQNAAFQWVQGQQQLNQQWFEHQQQMFSHHQQSNQQWANAAMVGVQQAQLGVKQWYDFAVSTQQSVAQMLAGAEQRQAVMVEQAIHKANVKKWTTRITIIALVLVGIVALFGCSFFAMMHLY